MANHEDLGSSESNNLFYFSNFVKGVLTNNMSQNPCIEDLINQGKFMYTIKNKKLVFVKSGDAQWLLTEKNKPNKNNKPNQKQKPNQQQ